MRNAIAEGRSGISSRLVFSAASFACAVIVGFSALVAVPLPGTPVPATLQTFALLACAGLLGRSYALQMVLWYVAIGLAGAPFFTGGGGAGALFGATGGYIAGFFAASAIVGYLSSRRGPLVSKVAIYAAAAMAVYVPGLLWLKFSTGAEWSAVLSMGLLPFILFDLVKASAAASINRLFRR